MVRFTFSIETRSEVDKALMMGKKMNDDMGEKVAPKVNYEYYEPFLNFIEV
jgi:hypothetical protein